MDELLDEIGRHLTYNAKPGAPIRKDWRDLLAQFVEALKQADRALNNLIDEDGHAGLLLRKHPEPCRRLDFCVMNDARQVQGRLRNAVRALTGRTT